MTDLERIHFIEETFGFKLHHVPIEKLGTDYVFKALYDNGTRNYSTNPNGDVIGLALDFSPVFLLPQNYLTGFKSLNQLRLKNVFLSDISFLKELKGITSLDLSANGLSDVSFLKELKRITSLDISSNNLSDVSFLKELKGLISLDIRDNEEIKDFSFIKELKGLTSLYLSDNRLSEVSFLKELKGLTSLFLSSNSLCDVSFLKEFKGLTSFNLRNNSLCKISFLKELKGLTSLDLTSNSLIDISFLKEFKGLTSLDLSYNKLSGISSLKEIKGLTSLDLSYNRLSDASSLKEIKGLTSLNLRKNMLSDVSFLKEIKGLTSLDLSYNNLSNISFLKELKGITSLELRNNRLSDVSSLKEIKGLTSLDLSNNKEIKDYSFLKGSTGLTSLNLSCSNLKNISFLKELKGLTSLDLSDNKGIKNYSFLKEFKGITSLDLRNNNLTDVSFLKEFKGITSLDLSYNKLTDVSFLKELKGITSLNLSYNSLSDVSFLKELKGITSLDLDENPIVIPPKEIVEEGFEAILEYFRQAEKYKTEKAYEAKILIIGEPDAGKTTLMELLFNKKHRVPLPEREQPSTLGVEVKSNRSFKHPTKGLPDIKAHIWDFGGQDIQYMLHQYFLTDDSVYVLLTDGRSGKTRYGYWFHIIGLLGKNSPVLVLLNRHKGQDTVIPFDAKLYKETFSELKILDIGEIDFGNLNHRWDSLIRELAAKLSELPIVGQPTLKPWKPIRQEIEVLQKKHITLKEFEEICYNNGLEEPKEVKFLLEYFHKIGFALNYNEETLQNTVFLDPNWITHAIYDALSDTVIIDRNGQFSKDDLYKHWQGKQCDKKHIQAYDQTECNYLLNLMLKNRFEVCYPLQNRPGYFIVPMKLPDRRPDYEFETLNSLRFRYQYPFMPEGLLSRLIVRMHEYIEEGKVWFTGALFREDGCIAEILQQETTQEGIKFIGIRISGSDLHKRQQFLRNIRREVEHIHKNTFPYIKFSEMVVCNCPVCEKNPTPNYYPFEDLQTYIEVREKEVFCTKGKQRVDIHQMIDEVYPPDDFDREGNKKPIEPKPEIRTNTIKIFLASSAELSEDRSEFEKFISRKNKEYINQGIFLDLIIWEDFIDAMSATRLQDEYNKAIEGCDIFVSLFHTKVGKYTEEEFDKAFGTFKVGGKPLVYTYFKDSPINMNKITPEINTLLNFKQKLIDLGHFPTIYNNIEDLKYKFGDQLVKILKSPLV